MTRNALYLKYGLMYANNVDEVSALMPHNNSMLPLLASSASSG